MTSPVKAVALAMAAISLATMLVALAMAWLASTLPAQRPSQPAASNFAARVQSTRSCESLKALCTDVASGYDSQHAAIGRLNRLTDELLIHLAWFAVGWAALTTVAFFYIFIAARRQEKS